MLARLRGHGLLLVPTKLLAACGQSAALPASAQGSGSLAPDLGMLNLQDLFLAEAKLPISWSSCALP